jgi:hypothetical protein
VRRPVDQQRLINQKRQKLFLGLFRDFRQQEKGAGIYLHLPAKAVFKSRCTVNVLPTASEKNGEITLLKVSLIALFAIAQNILLENAFVLLQSRQYTIPCPSPC